MTKNIFTALAMTTAIAFTSVPAVAQETDLGTVVATVNGEEITLGHMLVLSAQLPQEYNQLPDDVLFDAVLDQLVRQAAIAQGLEGGLSTASELALENQRRTFMATETLNARVAPMRSRFSSMKIRPRRASRPGRSAATTRISV